MSAEAHLSNYRNISGRVYVPVTSRRRFWGTRPERNLSDVLNRPHLALSRGIALLAFTQRSIRVSRAHISTNRQPKKAIPAIVKTLGDRIQIKRLETGISLKQLAKTMSVRVTETTTWENDRAMPSPEQLALLGHVLGCQPNQTQQLSDCWLLRVTLTLEAA